MFVTHMAKVIKGSSYRTALCGRGGLFAGSFHGVYNSTNPAEVTCKNCLKRMEKAAK